METQKFNIVDISFDAFNIIFKNKIKNGISFIYSDRYNCIIFEDEPDNLYTNRFMEDSDIPNTYASIKYFASYYAKLPLVPKKWTSKNSFNGVYDRIKANSDLFDKLISSHLYTSNNLLLCMKDENCKMSLHKNNINITLEKKFNNEVIASNAIYNKEALIQTLREFYNNNENSYIDNTISNLCKEYDKLDKKITDKTNELTHDASNVSAFDIEYRNESCIKINNLIDTNGKKIKLRTDAIEKLITKIKLSDYTVIQYNDKSSIALRTNFLINNCYIELKSIAASQNNAINIEFYLNNTTKLICSVYYNKKYTNFDNFRKFFKTQEEFNTYKLELLLTN